MHRVVLTVAKRPTPGHTKTRLCPPLSPHMAARLYECFLKDTLGLMRAVPGVARLIAYLPVTEAGYFARLAPDFGLLPQAGETLGQRLDNALNTCLNDGFDRAVIMNSDSPTLPPEYLSEAFRQLERADAVFGPCEDGGYYLVGLKAPQPRLLRDVQMSTPHVLRDTLEAARREGVAVALLPTWYDVDTCAELERLEQEVRRTSGWFASETRAFLGALHSGD
jgi:rSAM/selenodomain-associated transferase 1